MPPGRPAKPIVVPLNPSPLEQAYADLAEGAMSYEGAAEFTSLSTKEIERAVSAGEIEWFTHKRRVLLVASSVRMWLAKKLARERQERERRELLGR